MIKNGNYIWNNRNRWKGPYINRNANEIETYYYSNGKMGEVEYKNNEIFQKYE